MTLHHVTATGDLTDDPKWPYATRGCVRKVILTPSRRRSTLVLRDGGSDGTVRLSLQAAARGNSVVADFGPDGVEFSRSPHVTLEGAGAVAMIEFHR